MLFRLFLKDWRVFLSDRVAFGVTFLVPVVLIYIFGQVFGGTAGGKSQPISLPLLNLSSAPFPVAVEKALTDSPNFRIHRGVRQPDGTIVPYTPETLRATVASGKTRMALLIPEDQGGSPIGLRARLFVDPRNEMEIGIAEGLLQREVFQQLPSAMQGVMKSSLAPDKMGKFQDEMAEVVARSFRIEREDARRSMDQFFGTEPVPDAGAEDAPALPGSTKPAGAPAPAQTNFFAQLVDIEKEQVTGVEVRSPGATRQVGGWSLMFLLFAVTGFATSLFEEKNNGITQRILSGPATRNQVLLGKFCFSISLGIVQLTSLFLAGWVLFGVDVFANLPGLALAVFSAAAACSGFGMLLASFCRTPSQVQGLGTLLILTMSAVGGAWFPVSMMPDTVQLFSRATVVYWAQESFYDALWRRLPLVEMLPTAGLLLGIAVVVSAIALWRFRRSSLL